MLARKVLNTLPILLLTQCIAVHAVFAVDPRHAHINAPLRLDLPQNARPVVVALVDDGVDLDDEQLEPFIWKNTREVPDNGKDDDSNGFVDDVTGWDISDNDSSPHPPEMRKEEFYHGTELALTIVRLIRRAYGEPAAQYVKILPIKALADEARTPYIKDGYRGIEHALLYKPDVILSAWGNDAIKPYERDVLGRAEQLGALVISSAGNYSTETPQYPAALDSVLAVSAVSAQGEKLPRANFGSSIDLVAPGYSVSGKEILSDTSLASAFAAAAAALVKSQHPEFPPHLVRAALIDSAQKKEESKTLPSSLEGRLGSGLLDVAKAVAWTPQSQEGKSFSNSNGMMILSSEGSKRIVVDLSPHLDNILFSLHGGLFSRHQGTISFWQGEGDSQELMGRYPLEKFPRSLSFANKRTVVEYELSRSEGMPPALRYRAQSISQGSRFCSETVTITKEQILTDGSGEKTYEPRTTCKWLITAPPGMVAQIAFKKFDTQAKTDLLYFFHGRGTHEKIIAIFSGHEIPPVVKGWSNELLVWFVTDTSIEGDGWEAEITFIPQS